MRIPHAIFAAGIVLAGLVPFVGAQAVAAGIDARDAIVARAAAFLSEPPQFEIEAHLYAPTTEYGITFSKEWGDAYRSLGNDLEDAGLLVGLSDPGERGYRWQWDISCGFWSNDDGFLGKWEHPDGEPPKCPHGQGTDHPGTITVRAAPFRMAVREKVPADDIKSRELTGEERAQIAAAARIVTYAWAVECRYADGSKSGRARCAVTPYEEPQPAAGSAATNAAAPGMPKGAGAAAGVGAGAAAAGAVYYWWRSRRSTDRR